MTKCIYCGQYGEKYKPCPFCGAPQVGAPHGEEKWENCYWSYNSQEDYFPVTVDGKRTVYVNALNIREYPTVNSRLVGRLSKGETVSPIQEDGAWIKIGKRQWVHSRYVTA